MNNELINEKLTELNSLIEKNPGRKRIPVSIFLQEASNLYEWCKKDKEALTNAGLDWNLVEDLPVRIYVLRFSQSNWTINYNHYLNCQSALRNEIRKAKILRDEIVHHFYFAINKTSKDYARIKKIDKKNSGADIIQNLLNLTKIAMRHKKELSAVGFNFKLLDQAKSKSLELPKFLAKVNSELNESMPLQVLRNRAYQHLKEAVERIRVVGKYVFWKEKGRLKGYSSQYISMINRERRKKIEKIEKDEIIIKDDL